MIYKFSNSHGSKTYGTGVGIRTVWSDPISFSPKRAGQILTEPDRAEKPEPDSRPDARARMPTPDMEQP